MNLRELLWFTLFIYVGTAQRLAPYLYRWRNVRVRPNGRQSPANFNGVIAGRRTPSLGAMSGLRLKSMASKYNDQRLASKLANQRMATKYANQRLASKLSKQRLASKLSDQRLAFMDPVYGKRHSISYQPIVRSKHIGQYYAKDKIRKLSKLKRFPAKSSSYEVDAAKYRKRFKGDHENTYAYDDKFFRNLHQKRRQNIGGNLSGRKRGRRKMAKKTGLRIVPKTSLWDRLLTYLLNDWESQ